MVNGNIDGPIKPKIDPVTKEITVSEVKSKLINSSRH